jgi:hypothetical protein
VVVSLIFLISSSLARILKLSDSFLFLSMSRSLASYCAPMSEDKDDDRPLPGAVKMLVY